MSCACLAAPRRADPARARQPKTRGNPAHAKLRNRRMCYLIFDSLLTSQDNASIVGYISSVGSSCKLAETSILGLDH
jgi:hypothetical protein